MRSYRTWWTRCSTRPRLSGSGRRRHRPQAQLAAARIGGPGEGGGDGRRGRHAWPHARDHARRPPGHALQAERRAIRRGGEDRRHRPAESRRSAAHLCDGARRHHDPALQPDQHQGNGGAEGAEPFQPAARRHDHRAARARLHAERRPEPSSTKAAKDVLPATAHIDYAGSVARFQGQPAPACI